jgi:hypothetical protein
MPGDTMLPDPLRVPTTLVPHPWPDSLIASLFGYAVTTGLLCFGLPWFGVLKPSQSQLDSLMVVIISFIDSLFGWGVFLVPVAFSYRPGPRPARSTTICIVGSAIGLVLTGLETWVLLVDPHFRTSGAIYLATGTLNALLATTLLLTLRRVSARHNKN